MDSYEGSHSDPLSLHKYLYCHVNPVNVIDPSGHLTMIDMGEAMKLVTGLAARTAPVLMRIPGRIAARGFMKWAWIIGGIGAGVEYLTRDLEFGIEVQTQLQLNPTGSEHAYKLGECVEFAADAVEYLRRKGEAPKRIKYDSLPGLTRGDFIYCKEGPWFFSGRTIASNGHHEGVLLAGRVFDNNVPFGVPRSLWESIYLVAPINQAGEITIGEADRTGYGKIKVE